MFHSNGGVKQNIQFSNVFIIPHIGKLDEWSIPE